MQTDSLSDFYAKIRVPAPVGQNMGHFNVFDLEELAKGSHGEMPYNRRLYYKISLIEGRYRAEYADKTIDIAERALVFATPLIPYRWIPLEMQRGQFCIFTPEFMDTAKTGVTLEAMPLFQPGGLPVFSVNEEQGTEAAAIFTKIRAALNTEYAYKYDQIRAYVIELLHCGQRLQPDLRLYSRHNAADRIASLFAELLERQFPVASPDQRLRLRTPSDYADRLAVHVNHLNKTLKDATGLTTTELLARRLFQEAKILLSHTDWTVSQIADCLGFAEVAHFSGFFKRRESRSPAAFRAAS